MFFIIFAKKKNSCLLSVNAVRVSRHTHTCFITFKIDKWKPEFMRHACCRKPSSTSSLIHVWSNEFCVTTTNIINLDLCPCGNKNKCPADNWHSRWLWNSSTFTIMFDIWYEKHIVNICFLLKRNNDYRAIYSQTFHLNWSLEMLQFSWLSFHKGNYVFLFYTLTCYIQLTVNLTQKNYPTPWMPWRLFKWNLKSVLIKREMRFENKYFHLHFASR